jgi:DNA-binding Lrp family transcriptional regulator
MNALEKKFIRALESDLPGESRPFLKLAEQFGLSEGELLNSLKALIADGTIRRYGARVSHQRVGFSANVMVIWQAPSEEVEKIGQIMATFAAVSHCYERPTFPGFPYNLYTMIHGRSREECETVIAEISSVSGVTSYRALWSIKEFKKSTPRYSELLNEDAPRNKD